MSAKDVYRVEVMGRVKAGSVRLGAAAALLAVSYRQVKRIWQRYRTGGAKALVHRHVGHVSNRRRPGAERTRVLQLIREKYSGDITTRFGPTLAAEHLASEDGIVIDHETLRRWMLTDGLWSRRRTRSPYRQRRERKAHFGELVQLDGSPHAWLEARGPSGCAMTLVDDATGQTLLQFAPQETIWAAAAVLRAWVETYGVPQALYTDWKNVYVRRPTEEERLAGRVPVTHFGRMCARLDIQIIPASSPQAKGRIERQQGTQQDRLIKNCAAPPSRPTRPPMRSSPRGICRTTMPALRARRRLPTIFIAGHRPRGGLTASFSSRRRAPSPMIGWCAITIGSCNWSAPVRACRRAAPCGSAKPPMDSSRSGIGIASCAAKRLRRRRRSPPRRYRDPRQPRAAVPACPHIATIRGQTIRGGMATSRRHHPSGRCATDDDSAPVDAAGAVDAQDAPTAPCKTRRARFAQRPQGILLFTRGHFS